MTQLVARVDDSLVDAIDELVRHGEVASRSDAVRVALAQLVDQRRRAATARQIIEGYERIPETDQELSWAEANMRQLIEEEPW